MMSKHIEPWNRCRLTELQTNILTGRIQLPMDVLIPSLQRVDRTAVDGWTVQLLSACSTPSVQFSLVVSPTRLH